MNGLLAVMEPTDVPVDSRELSLQLLIQRVPFVAVHAIPKSFPAPTMAGDFTVWPSISRFAFRLTVEIVEKGPGNVAPNTTVGRTSNVPSARPILLFCI